MTGDIRKQAKEAAARVAWSVAKLKFELKRKRALDALVANEDWLDGKSAPLSEDKASAKGRS